MSTPRDHTCPVCEHVLGPRLLEVTAIPALANALWDDADAARRAARGDIDLRCCDYCGHLTNVAFDLDLVSYGPGYENSLHFSPTFADYARRLAKRLVETYEIRGGEVVEVGCGQGDFLALLAELGANRGLGYDPSYEGPTEITAGSGSVTFARALYPDGGEASSTDLVCCRHVLEHQPRPLGLVQRLARALDGGDAIAYFEVPDAGYMLEHGAVWDLIYEHPQYFSAASLLTLLRTAGFQPLEVETTYGDQFLAVDAAWPAPAAPDDGRHGPPSGWSRAAERFGARFAATIEAWQTRLAEFGGAGARIVLWGAGSKGISFLNLVPLAAEIELVVDVNPRKHGLHVPGTGHRISAPEVLTGTSLDLVVLLNPLYESEVRQRLVAMEVDVDAIVA